MFTSLRDFLSVFTKMLNAGTVRLEKSDGREIDRLRVDLLHPGGILRLRAHLDLEGVDLQEEGGLCTRDRSRRSTLQGSFSAVSKPIFASE